MILVHFQCKPFNNTIIYLFPNHWWWKSWSWLVLWRPIRPSRSNTKQDVLFIIGDWNAKVGNQDTWSNRQVWPWSTKWNRENANRVLPREPTGHSKRPCPTTKETTLYMDMIRWAILKSNWLYSLQLKLEKLYTVSKNKTCSCLWLRSWTPYCQIQT